MGLVELTRKRQGQNIYELFGETCPTCGGLGHLAHVPGEEPVAAVQLSAVSTRGTGYSSPSQSFSNRPSAKDNNSRDNNSRDKSLSLEPQAEPQELDLMNHPSYQDKNGRGGRRRRRQRPDGRSDSHSDSRPDSRSDSRSENGPSRSRRSSGSPANPITVDRDKDKDRSDRSVSPREKVSSQVEERDLRSLLSRKIMAHAVETITAAKTKRTRNSRRKPEEPPEIVVVEMTEEQQRIYAVMGVSPLVLSEQAVEDPQNVLISVVLPGEAEALRQKIQSEALAIGAVEGTDDDEKAPPQKRIIETPSRLDSEKTAEIESANETSPSENNHAAPVLNGSSGEAEESSSDAPVRRRKRSATRKNSPSDELTYQTEAAATEAPFAAPKKTAPVKLDVPAEED